VNSDFAGSRYDHLHCRSRHRHRFDEKGRLLILEAKRDPLPVAREFDTPIHLIVRELLA
jgi:hypothetical protein